MANPEHLAILKQGAEAWNRWRAKHLDNPMNWRQADLRLANISKAILAGAKLDNAILDGADLSECDLYEASFREARLTGAKLRETYLHRANLNDADLSGADCEKTIFGSTGFGHTNLSAAKNLSQCLFIGPCTIDLPTIEISWPLPLSFLQGCGLPDDYIEWLHQRCKRKPLRFYSCFISYSHADNEFAKRLYDDLQNNGVRCWCDRRELRIGQRLRQGIFEAIHSREKSIVVLSTSSLERPWVRREVETVLRLEDELGKEILVPIRLDGSIFETQQGWAAELLERRIGDFTDWKKHASYKKAFEELLRDLKAQTDS